MRILVACEESQAVTKAFRALGHKAFSCDILPCSGGHLEWHIQKDVLEVLNLPIWDMIIAFPPCTDLAVSGAAWFEKKRANGNQEKSIDFFMSFINAPCPKIAIENPVGIISGDYIRKHFPLIADKYGLPIKPSQKIQPWEFGDEAQKTTCLWLKGLPPLIPTKIVHPGEKVTFRSKDGKKRTMPKWYADCWHLKPAERAKMRSKTFPGIAKAMAEQWGQL